MTTASFALLVLLSQSPQVETPLADAIAAVTADTFDVQRIAQPTVDKIHHETAFHFANGAAISLHAIDGIVTAWNIGAGKATEGNGFLSAINGHTAKGLREFTAKKVGIATAAAGFRHLLHKSKAEWKHKLAWALVIVDYLSTGYAISTWMDGK